MIQGSRDFIIGSYVTGIIEGILVPSDGVIPYSGNPGLLPYETGKALGTFYGIANENN